MSDLEGWTVTYRGQANFFLGRFDKAASDFRQSLERRHEDPYAAIWLYLASARRHQADAIEALRSHAKEIDRVEWPGPVIALYLGEVDEGALLDSAQTSDARVSYERRMQALFYIGQWRLIAGDTAQARQQFEKVLASDLTDFVEFLGARAELRRLGE